MNPILIINFLMLVSNFNQVTGHDFSPPPRLGRYAMYPVQEKSLSPMADTVTLHGCGERAVEHRPARRVTRIVGGSETPYGAYPWQVTIQVYIKESYAFHHVCGGSLISSRLILTAAHCLGVPVDELRVVVGDHKLNATDKFEESLWVERAILHPEFEQKGEFSNDIALLVLRHAVRPSDYAYPICLPDAGAKIPVGDLCVVSGWGRVSPWVFDLSFVLRDAAVPVLAQDTCKSLYIDTFSPLTWGRHEPLLDGMLCAGPPRGGVGSNYGDSGGPLACPSAGRFVLNGIVSAGDSDKPGLYTRVAYYINWIQDNAAKLGLPLPKMTPPRRHYDPLWYRKKLHRRIRRKNLLPM